MEREQEHKIILLHSGNSVCIFKKSLINLTGVFVTYKQGIFLAVASKFYRIHCISEKYETHHLRYISFKIVPLCNYALLPATVKVFEAFLESIL